MNNATDICSVTPVIRPVDVECHDVLALIPRRLHDLHWAVVGRAREAGVEALLLTGSTARGARTQMSDIDYHLVGTGIEKEGLSNELDLHVVSAPLLRRRLREGDDFVHWSLRFGKVVFDQGIVKECVRSMREAQLWPDSRRKLEQARKSLALARTMIASGDADAALEQARTALTLTARWRLLEDKRFPLARAELPSQLKDSGHLGLASALEAMLVGPVSLEEIATHLDKADASVDPALGEAVHLSSPQAA